MSTSSHMKKFSAFKNKIKSFIIYSRYSFLMVIDGFLFLLGALFPLLRKGILFYIHNQQGGQNKDMEV